MTQTITVTQVTVISTTWTTTYGNVISGSIAPNGQPFLTNDFLVPAPGTSGQGSYKGTIQSIQGYTCQVIDDLKNVFILYFGGGTAIESVNKAVPEAGDTIYWLGSPKPGGKANEYNCNQCICL
jgi:hypothetical protein